jgi:hypothetical protein
MKDVTVFYAGLLYGEFSHGEYDLIRTTAPNEIYNGAWTHVNNRRSKPYFGPMAGWYRFDQTPVLESHVPKELLAMMLLLT